MMPPVTLVLTAQRGSGNVGVHLSFKNTFCCIDTRQKMEKVNSRRSFVQFEVTKNAKINTSNFSTLHF